MNIKMWASTPWACAEKLCRIFRKRVTTLGPAVAMAAIAFVQPLEAAQPTRKATDPVIVIGSDRGGRVSARAAEILRIRAAGQRVEIRGRVCLSTCTMYLGLPDTCISPTTVFAFHGPSYYGAPLSAHDFEYWSQVIARHYPEPIRAWYLRKGRTRISTAYRMKGRALIRLGIPQC